MNFSLKFKIVCLSCYAEILYILSIKGLEWLELIWNVMVGMGLCLYMFLISFFLMFVLA